jgi:hypothetical protein
VEKGEEGERDKGSKEERGRGKTKHAKVPTCSSHSSFEPNWSLVVQVEKGEEGERDKGSRRNEDIKNKTR